MAVINRISEQEYRELLLNEPDQCWELWYGGLVEKPRMSMRHNAIAFLLGHLLQSQLDWNTCRVNVNGDRTRVSSRSYFIPDVIVIPAAYQRSADLDPQAPVAYSEPLPLVVEVWSRTTGPYDFAVKLQAYRDRGDEEIWFLHPYERTLTVWRRQSDGSYEEVTYRGGVVPVTSLPGVSIDLDALLDG